MKSSKLHMTRRESLGFLGGLMASTTITLPSGGWAQTVASISPPRLRSAMDNPDQVVNYIAKLEEFVLSFAERYPTQEIAPVTDELDQLYVLNCTTRRDIPLDYPAGAPMTYYAPAYVDGSLFNDPARPTVGPTMVFRRGTTTGVMLNNEIAVCGDAMENIQYSDDNPISGHTPHGFQVTNLHTHGLHVSPNAPSDDVLVTVDSVVPLPDDGHGGHKALDHAIFAGDGTYFPYFYDMRPDHPVGTFWYHPHKHGSVASQVAPGMAGALIVRENGDGDVDFDSLLAEHGITESEEEIIVLQTLKGQKAKVANGDTAVGAFYPQAYYGETFENVPSADCFGLLVGSEPLGVPTTVNGVVNPTITLQPGQIKRLRIVNAASGATFVPEFGADDQLELYAIAIDGIALMPAFDDLKGLDDPYYKISPRIDPATEPSRYWTTAEILTLAPGQRLDLLVRAKDTATPGIIQVKDPGVTKGQTDSDRATKFPPNVIETSTSQPGNLWQIQILDSNDNLRDQRLPTKRSFIDAPISRPPSPFAIKTEVPIQNQELVFRSKKLDAAPASGARNPTFTINGQNFDPDLSNPPQLVLGLNQITNWTLYSSNDAHIFHIHINSFQAVAREKPEHAPRVYEMPIWRDTIYFDGDAENTATRVIMASYQVDYTGEYVLHCHNLFHEDSGMMLSVAVEELE